MVTEMVWVWLPWAISVVVCHGVASFYARRASTRPIDALVCVVGVLCCGSHGCKHKGSAGKRNEKVEERERDRER